MKRALICGLLLTLTGCAFMDRLLIGEKDPATGEVVKPPMIEYVTGPVGAIPGYGGVAVGVIGLLTGLYKSVRARQEEKKKIGVMAGIEIARENWENIETVADLIRELRKGLPDKKTADAVDAELSDLRQKEII